MRNCTVEEIKFVDAALNYDIRCIGEKTRFWMVRTKRGYFFDEFVQKSFIALGWNIVTKETNFAKSQEEDLKGLIKNRYNETRPLGAINKCKSFIFDIQIGDYILIPSSGSAKVAIAKAGAYYEDERKGYDEEKEVIPKIENAEYEISQVVCPYRKRRHIKILKVITPFSMSYNLRQAISNYHGLSNLDMYGEDILNCIFDCYSYNGNMNIAINVGREKPLNPRDISRLLYGFTEFACALSDEENVSTTINLNSPGAVRMKLKNAAKVITKAKVPLIFIFLAITGGKGLGFELPGIVGTIREAKTLEIEVEKEKVTLEKEKENLRTQQIENASKIIKLVKDAEAEGVDVNYVLMQLEVLNLLNGNLVFRSEDIGDIDNETEEE